MRFSPEPCTDINPLARRRERGFRDVGFSPLWLKSIVKFRAISSRRGIVRERETELNFIKQETRYGQSSLSDLGHSIPRKHSPSPEVRSRVSGMVNVFTIYTRDVWCLMKQRLPRKGKFSDTELSFRHTFRKTRNSFIREGMMSKNVQECLRGFATRTRYENAIYLSYRTDW